VADVSNIAMLEADRPLSFHAQPKSNDIAPGSVDQNHVDSCQELRFKRTHKSESVREIAVRIRT
jgi:hypothetical protein